MTLEVSSSLGTQEGSSHCHGLEKPLGWIGSQGKLVEVGWALNGWGRSETKKGPGDQGVGLAREQ